MRLYELPKSVVVAIKNSTILQRKNVDRGAASGLLVAALAHSVLWLRLPIFVWYIYVSIVASDEVMVFHARVLEPDHSYAYCPCLCPILNIYITGHRRSCPGC